MVTFFVKGKINDSEYQFVYYHFVYLKHLHIKRLNMCIQLKRLYTSSSNTSPHPGKVQIPQPPAHTKIKHKRATPEGGMLKHQIDCM